MPPLNDPVIAIEFDLWDGTRTQTLRLSDVGPITRIIERQSVDAITCLHNFQWHQTTPTISDLTYVVPRSLDSYGNYYFQNSGGLTITGQDGTLLATYVDSDFKDLVNTWYGSSIETAADNQISGLYAQPIYSGRYVVGHITANHGSFFRHWWVLFSPAADGSLSVIGAVYFNGTTDAPFTNGIKAYEPLTTTQPILYGGYGGLSGLTFILGAMPSIQDFIDNTYAAGYGGVSPLAIRGAGYYPLGDTVDLTTKFAYAGVCRGPRGMGFILPDDDGNLFFYHYMNRLYIESTSAGGSSCPEVNGVIKPSYPYGCIIRASLSDYSYEDLAGSATHVNANTYVLPTGGYSIDNAHWQNPDGSDAIPFREEYTYISTGAAGGEDSYSMHVGGIRRRPNGKYWVPFYMAGYDDYGHYGNGVMYVRIKVFEFTPETQIAVLRCSGTCILRTNSETASTLNARIADQFLDVSIREAFDSVFVTICGPIYKTEFMLFRVSDE